MQYILFSLAMIVASLIECHCSLAYGQPKLIELSVQEGVFQGKIALRNPEQVWLSDRGGQLRPFALQDVTAFRKISDSFVPYSLSETRDQLRRELGGDFEVVGTGHYVVAGKPSILRAYAETFENHYRVIHHYFSVRNFEVHKPEFPLVAIVFPNHESFRRYAEKDNVKPGQGLRGYYHQFTNRIALFHDSQVSGTIRIPSGTLANSTLLNQQFPRFPLNTERSVYASFGSDSWANTNGSLESTMIHEATHQVAFNIGIHQRFGIVNPVWVVEGMATVFEAPGMRSSSLERTPGAKWNRSRLTAFQQLLKSRRADVSIQNLVANDAFFKSNVLDAYAVAWALTYFLIETRHREYSQYLERIAARTPLKLYSDKERLSDFQEFFGTDLQLLESHFLRFMRELK